MNSLNSSHEARAGLSGFIVGPLLFLLACWLFWGFDETYLPEKQAVRVNKDYLDIEPRRVALGDPPVIHLNGFDRTCMDCHKLFPPRAEAPKNLFVHDHVVLNHGINDQCRNCHDLENRNRLVLYDMTTLRFSESDELCAKCHGPTYRDWERGMHGRSQGFWDESRGALRRLDCVDCHDPHSPRVPAMIPMKPLPAPNTLHLVPHAGDASAQEHHDEEESDPLRRTIMKGSGMKGAGMKGAGMKEAGHAEEPAEREPGS